MGTYTINGLTAKEVRRVGESKWFYEHLKFLALGLGLPIIVFIIFAWSLPQEFNRAGRVVLLAIPILCFLVFYWVWIAESTKQGKAFLTKCKEEK